jgi:WD40 repeat protein
VRRLASGGWKGTVKLWEVLTGPEVRTLTGFTERVSSVAFSPDGHWLASGSSDETVKLGGCDGVRRSHSEWPREWHSAQTGVAGLSKLGQVV